MYSVLTSLSSLLISGLFLDLVKLCAKVIFTNILEVQGYQYIGVPTYIYIYIYIHYVIIAIYRNSFFITIIVSAFDSRVIVVITILLFR